MVPFVCDNSPGNNATAEFTINNLALSGGFANTLNITGNAWANGLSENAEVNVLLLNAQSALATSAGTVTQVLFVKNNGSNLTIPSGDDAVSIGFGLSDAFQLFYMCDSQISTAATTFGLSGSPECVVLAPMLGEAAFTPTITTSN